ncbi:MAG: histidine kinase [Flavobacteriales bacterium]|nr:histidine kinase [Flavobacteriales bacterium]
MKRAFRLAYIKEALLTAVFWFALILAIRGFVVTEVGMYRILFISVSCALIVYLNSVFLFPKFLLSRKYFQFASLGLFFLIAFAILFDFLFVGLMDVLNLEIINTNKEGTGIGWVKWYLMAPMGYSIILSSLYKMVAQSSKDREKKLEFELRFLKGQINPHFLFNSLNNLYTLTIKKSDKAPEIIMELSNLLNYSLYECDQDTVPLSSEIKAIENYCNLARLKDSKGLNIDLQLETANGNLLIAPMILITFVENAFKHSNVEDTESGWIKIELLTSGKKVHFKVSNTKPIHEKHYPENSSGIGLVNIERRLDLFYPNQHELKINETDREFEVLLELTTA